MALVRKFQGGGLPQPFSNTDEYRINEVSPTLYFNVGDSAYDLMKYKDLVWRNFDLWIEFNDYNSNVKDKSRKFINEVLEQLTSGTAKFNPDYTLTMKDVNNQWDPTSGFNKRGKKLWSWLTSDVVDDARGIPHVSMRYLVEVLNSSPMLEFKKPQIAALSDLTKKVMDVVVKRDFGNSWVRFRETWSSFPSSEKIRMFKDALKDFKNNTDFSIYSNQSVRELGPKIDEFLKFLETNPTLDLSFIDKASSNSFYGIGQWMEYRPPLPTTPTGGSGGSGGSGYDNGGTPSGDGSYDDGSGSGDGQGGNGGSSGNKLANATRVLKRDDISKVLDPTVKQLMDLYMSTINVRYIRESIGRNTYIIPVKRIPNMEKYVNDKRTYLDLITKLLQNNYTKESADRAIHNRSVEINRYILGKSSLYNDTSMSYLISIMLNRASVLGNYEYLFGQNIAYITDSYDPNTLTYLAVDKANEVIFTIPAIFIRTNSRWSELTNKAHAYLKSTLNGAPRHRTYSTGEIYDLGIMSYFKDKKVDGYLKYLLKMFNWKEFPKLDKGGILKAMTGAQFYGSGTSPQLLGRTVQLVRLEREARRQNIVNLRLARRDLRTNARAVAYEESRTEEDLRKETEKQDYLDRQVEEINSWEDLAKNFDEHDAWVVHTLLSDLVAFGGSLSGGMYNPITDAATISSMVGTIGTVATDKSMSTLEKIGYGALGVLLDASALIPEIGAAGKSVKLGLVARRAVPLLSKFIRIGALGITGKNALGPLYKLYNGESLTKADWTNLAYFAEALLMGSVSRRTTKGGRKYTVAVSPKTNYLLKTSTRGWVNVSELTYHSFSGNRIKDLLGKNRPKSGGKGSGKKGKPSTPAKEKPLFRTTEGQKIYAKDFQPKGVVGRVRNPEIKGRVLETTGGYRLMTPKEVSESMGLTPIVINGETHYPVPRSYTRIKAMMETGMGGSLRDISIKNPFTNRVRTPLINENGDVVLKSNGDPIMINASPSRAKQMADLYKKNHGKESTIDVPDQVLDKPVPKRGGGEETRFKPTDKTKTSLKPEVLSSFYTNYRSLGESAKVKKKLDLLLRKSNYEVPLPKIERNNIYYYDNASKLYVSNSLKDLKTKQEMSESEIRRFMKSKKAIKFYGGGKWPFLGEKGKLLFEGPQSNLWWERFFGIGKDDQPLLYSMTNKKTSANLGSAGVTPTGGEQLLEEHDGEQLVDETNLDETYSQGLERRGDNEYASNKFTRLLNRVLRPHHLYAIGQAAIAWRDAENTRRIKNAATLPAYTSVNNNLSYRPTFAVQRDFLTLKQKAENSRRAALNTASDLRELKGSLYALNIVNDLLDVTNLNERATEFLTNQSNMATMAKTLTDLAIANAGANYLKTIAAKASIAANDEEAATKKSQALANILGMYLEEAASKEKARNILGLYALKKHYEIFSPEYANLSKAILNQKDIKTKFELDYKNQLAQNNLPFDEAAFELAWQNNKEFKDSLAEIDKYLGIYDTNWFSMMYDAVEPGYFDYFFGTVRDLNRQRGGFKVKKKGGTLSYEQRMSLKLQDAMNKTITTDKKERNSTKRELIREYNKNMRLISKRSETLLKAAMGIK